MNKYRFYELRYMVMQYPQWREGDDLYLRAVVDRAADQTHPVLGKLILQAIIKGWSYDTALANYDICCGRELWYKLYRDFFSRLDRARKSQSPLWY